MAQEYRSDMPWVIVELKRQKFALPACHVREMLVLPDVACVPGTPPYVRGALNLRGKVMPLIDLRLRLGMTSALAETQAFCGMMGQREEDHKRWLAELEASVKEGREFRLTTDPHQCAFGRWYDGYRAEDAWERAVLSRFDGPHREIHATAGEVLQLAASGARDRALQAIETKRRDVLGSMLALFRELCALVREHRREMAVVITGDGRDFAVCVDGASSVEKLDAGCLEPLPAGAAPRLGGVVQKVARSARDSQPLLVIETGLVIPSGAQLGAAS